MATSAPPLATSVGPVAAIGDVVRRAGAVASVRPPFGFALEGRSVTVSLRGFAGAFFFDITGAPLEKASRSEACGFRPCIGCARIVTELPLLAHEECGGDETVRHP